MLPKRFKIFFLITIFVTASSMFHSSYAWAGCGDTYTITATAGLGGSISPSGSIEVVEGESQFFSITPSFGYSIQSVTVDGTSVGTPSSYTFYSVSSNHTISVTFSSGSNQAPVIQTIQGDDVSDGAPNPKVITVGEHTSFNFDIVANDPNAANNVTQSLTGAPAGHTFIKQGAPNNPSTYRFSWTTPNLAANTNYDFTVNASDGSLTDAHNIRITVTAVNDAPIANAQSVSTPREVAKSIILTGSDPEGGALTFNIGTSPTHGTLSGTGANKTYTPNTGFAGSDTFTFTVTDTGALSSAPATITIDVTDLILNNPGFQVQPLPNAHSLITAPNLPAGQTVLFREDQIVEVKRTSVNAPGTPSFKFVKGTPDSFTLTLIPSSAPPPASPAAYYVIERYTPIPQPRPDGKPEDIGQAFSIFGNGPVTPAGTSTGGNFTASGLNSETDYCFRVKAVSSTGLESAHSKTECGYTPKPPPA